MDSHSKKWLYISRWRSYCGLSQLILPPSPSASTCSPGLLLTLVGYRPCDPVAPMTFFSTVLPFDWLPCLSWDQSVGDPCSYNTSQPGNAPRMNLTREESSNSQAIGAMLHVDLWTCIAPTWTNCTGSLNVPCWDIPARIHLKSQRTGLGAETPSMKHDSYVP